MSRTLGPDESLSSSNPGFTSPNGEYQLIFDADTEGDLKVISLSTKETIWSAMANHSVPAIVGGSVLMKADGNLVGLSSDPSRREKPVWGSGTDSGYDAEGNEVPNVNPGAVLILQDNGTLVIRREGGEGRVVWATVLTDDMSPFVGPDQVKGGLWIRSSFADEIDAQKEAEKSAAEA